MREFFYFRFGILCFCVFLGLSVPVFAQVFSLDLPGTTLQPGFNTQLNLNGNFQSGNVSLSDLSWSSREDYLFSTSRLTVILSHETGTQAGVVYTNSGVTSVRYIQPLSPLFEMEELMSHEYNSSQQLDYRYLAGGGLRVAVVGPQDVQSGTNVTYGLGVLNESQSQSGVGTQAFRLVNYVAGFWAVTPSLNVNTTTRMLNNIANFSDFRSDFVGKVSLALTSSWSVNMELDLNYNNVQVPGVMRLDSQLTSGVNLNF